MSIRVMTWVWDHSTSRGTDRLVLLAIADAANDTGGDAWPSVETLARKAGVDARTVQRRVKRLVESGELVVERSAGQHGVNVYRVVMTPGKVSPPTDCHPWQSVTPTNQANGTDKDDNPRQSVTPGNLSPRQSVTQTVLSVCSSSTSPESSKNTRSATTRDADVTPLVDASFDRFWVAYPRKVAKGAARKAWATAVKNGADPEHVITAAAAHRNRHAAARTETRFIPHPATWLNSERWDDEPEQPTDRRRAVGEHQSYRNPPDMSAYEGDL